jgi:hypothetical protein
MYYSRKGAKLKGKGAKRIQKEENNTTLSFAPLHETAFA